jgi:hypothetical protein
VRTRWLSLVALLTLVAVAGAGAALSLVPRVSSAVPTALASMPRETLTASVTDWARVRALLPGPAAGGEVSPEVLLDRAYETDLSAVSVLGEMAPVMERAYGWSVLDAQWEGLAQSRVGASLVVQMPPGFDLEVVREGLSRLGYLPPFESDGVWRGGPGVVASIHPTLTPLLSHAVVLDDGRRVVFSDTAAYAARTARVVDGLLPSLAETESVRAVADQLDGTAAAVVHRGGRACSLMGFSRAARGEQAQARARIAAVGGLRRYSAVGLGLAPGPGGAARRPPLVVAMHFDDASTVLGEAARRARLAVGEAPAQGGTFGSRFAVASAARRGGDVVLRLRPREVDAQLLSDLNAGQLLFAACG